MSMIESALGLAKRGLHVFALRPREKVPATEHGCKDASVEVETVRAMWRDPACNVGIATGYASDVFVLDVDGEDGARSFEVLQDQNGQLPRTPEAITARGRHVYFRYPGAEVEIRNSAKKVAPGIDIRTDGGYVVAPPSIHPSGDVYRWAEGRSPFEMPFAPAPDWLIAKLVKKSEPKREYAPDRDHSGHTKYGAAALDAECRDLASTHEGGRNDKLNRVAFRIGQLICARHLSSASALSDLRHAAEACGLEKREAEQTIASGLRAGMDTPCSSDPNPDEPRQQPQVLAKREESAPAREERPKTNAEPVIEVLTAGESADRALEFLTDPSRAKMARFGFDKFDKSIGGMPPGTMTVIGGRRGSGKSSVMLAFALKQQATEIPIGIVSCEDSEWIWGARIMSYTHRVDTSRFFDYPPDEMLVGNAVLAARKAHELGIHLTYPIGRKLNHVLACVTELVKKRGCRVIMVDYLQAIAAGEDRYVARTDAAMALKALCHQLGVPLVLGSQLKRPNDGNAFREPTDADLKDSGDIENMAEAILLLWNKGDQEGAKTLGKVSKVKWSPRRPRFAIVRNEYGAIVDFGDSNEEPPTSGFARRN